MGIKKLFNTIAKKFASLTTEQQNDEVLKWFREGGAPSLSNSEAYNIYKITAPVGDAIDLISGKASAIKPIIKNTTTKENIIQHPVLEFLKKPNKQDNYLRFIESVTTNFLIHNNSYMEVLGFIKSKPAAIYPLKNTWVQITQKSNAALYNITSTNFFQFLSGNFNIDRTESNILSQSKLQEIRHIKGFSLSGSGLEAASRLLSLKEDTELINQSKKHNVNLLKEGFNSIGLFTVETDDRNAFTQLSNDLLNKFSGSGNAKRPIVGRAGKIDYKDFGQTNKDMEYATTKTMSEASVFQRYEIPGPLNDKSAQTFDNYQTAIFTLYDQAVIPLIQRIFMDLTEMFQQRGMLTDNEIIDFDESSIPALQIRANGQVKILRDTNIASVNELRSTIGLETNDDPQADVIYQPGNLLPLSFDTFTEDNLTVPSKQFTDEMLKSGFNKEECFKYWNEFKRTSQN
jgi:HK97 family phage portal protein